MNRSLGKAITLVVLALVIVVPCQAQGNDEGCPDTLPSRLQPGHPAQNTPGTPLNMRDAPSTSGSKLGEIPPEALFDVLEGPVCADGYAWWQVDYQGLTGWTVEGDSDSYWTVPVDDSQEYVTLWNTQSLRQIRSFQGEENTAYGLAVSSAKGLVALGTGYPNNLIRIWDYRSGEEVAVLDPAYEGDARRLSFSTNGELLAVGGLPGDYVQVWNVNTGELVHQLESSSVVVTFRPNTVMLAYVEFPRNLVMWDTSSQQEDLRWPDAVQVQATDLVFSPDGSVLAIVEYNGPVVLWNVASGEPITTLDHFAAVKGLAFSPDSETVATVHCREADPNSNVTCLHQKIIQWDVQTGERGQVIDLAPGLEMWKNARLAFSPDGAILAMSEMSRLWLFDSESGQQLAMHESFPAWNFAFTDDQKYLIGADTFANVEIWGLDAD